MKVKCPTCKKITEYASDNPFRPFCSERCQTLDLGAWADEKYAVPVAGEAPEAVNQNSEDEPPVHEDLDDYLSYKYQLN